MKDEEATLAAIESLLDTTALDRINLAVDRIVSAKERGGKVIVVTGSGPNLHEGITTLVAELMRHGVVDGVTTSSAVISHEMGGTLDKVKRVDGRQLGIDPALLPHGNAFELTMLDDQTMAEIRERISLNDTLIARLEELPGKVITKAAGNLGYPMGLYLEHVAPEISNLARARSISYETLAGYGADERTMIGTGSRRNLPVLVTIPQLVGGGAVGSSIGDSMTITERAKRIAGMLESADVIIESAVALTQEIHDGPYETYTGHGLWASWEGQHTYSLRGKTLIRMDLDPALEKVWQAERNSSEVQGAIDKGLPKTKLFKVPFRMEMSGFARLEGSIPITGDIGAIWPVLARRVARRLGIKLAFVSYPQQTAEGQAMREWVVDNIKPFSYNRMMASVHPEGVNAQQYSNVSV